MNNTDTAFISAFDIVGNDPTGQVFKTVKDELFAMDMRLKDIMDAGLTVDEMKKMQSVRAATLTALSTVEKLGQKNT